MDRLDKNPPASEITPEGLYMNRREVMRNAVLFTATSAGVGGSLLWVMRGGRAEPRASERGGAGGAGPCRWGGGPRRQRAAAHDRPLRRLRYRRAVDALPRHHKLQQL